MICSCGPWTSGCGCLTFWRRQDVLIQPSGSVWGFAIARQLYDLMGAPLSERTVPGEGSTFSLEAPQGKRCNLPKQKEEVSFVAPEGRVLAVDDNLGNRAVL